MLFNTTRREKHEGRCRDGRKCSSVKHSTTSGPQARGPLLVSHGHAVNSGDLRREVVVYDLRLSASYSKTMPSRTGADKRSYVGVRFGVLLSDAVCARAGKGAAIL